MKRLVTTPDGMTELEITGTRRSCFVTLTVFGPDGRALRDEMWWSGHDEPLADVVRRLTGSTAEAAEGMAVLAETAVRRTSGR